MRGQDWKIPYFLFGQKDRLFNTVLKEFIITSFLCKNTYVFGNDSVEWNDYEKIIVLLLWFKNLFVLPIMEVLTCF